VGKKLGTHGYSFLIFAFQTSDRDLDQEVRNLEAAGDRESVSAARLLRSLKRSALRRSFARSEGLQSVHVRPRNVRPRMSSFGRDVRNRTAGRGTTSVQGGLRRAFRRLADVVGGRG
jgi:hypothetical protein